MRLVVGCCTVYADFADFRELSALIYLFLELMGTGKTLHDEFQTVRGG